MDKVIRKSNNKKILTEKWKIDESKVKEWQASLSSLPEFDQKSWMVL